MYVSGHVSGKKEALWFDETAASIIRFTVTTAFTGFSMVQSYSGVKLTNESAEGSGDLRWAATLRCAEAGGNSSRERRKEEGKTGVKQCRRVHTDNRVNRSLFFCRSTSENR